MQPGQIISPRDPSTPDRPGNGDTLAGNPAPVEATPPATPAPVQATPPPSAPSVPPVPTPSPQPTQPTSGAPIAAPAATTNWQFNPEQSSATPTVTERAPLPESIDWTASEFVAHDKSAVWYISVVMGGLLFAALDYILTKDVFSTAIIVVAAIAFTAYAARKPQMQQYRLSRQGIQVGHRLYGFQEYKSFSVAEEGGTASAVFMPLKRFMPPLTIYLTSDIEDQVVDFLSAFMPFEQHKADAVDSLLKRMRF